MLCTVIVLRIGKTRVQAQSRVGRDSPISREKSDLLGLVTSATANSKFQLSWQSFPLGLLLTIIRPQPRCLSILAPTRTVALLQLRSGLWSTEGLDRCSREWNRHGKESPPCPGPWQQVPTSHRRSFDRPRCPVPRASSEISGISNFEKAGGGRALR